MSAPRVISYSRCAFIRGANRRPIVSSLNFTSPAVPQRQFSSVPRLQEDAITKPATGSDVSPSHSPAPAPGINANSIAIMKVPVTAVPADVKKILTDAGVTVKNLQMRFDRFTFEADNSVFVELGSKAEVKKAITALDKQILNKRALKVFELRDTFIWDSGFKKGQRFFYYDAKSPYEAIKGHLEGRRRGLYVEHPGWLEQIEGKSINASRRNIIQEILEPFNVETLGSLRPVWNKGLKDDKNFLACIDFTTKEDAQRAVDALNGTVVKGRRVELRPLKISSKIAKQIARVNEGVFAKLQEAGLITTESENATTGSR